MVLDLVIRAERLVLQSPFRISRGVKTHADVVVAELHAEHAAGRGECVPYARYGETVESVVAELADLGPRLRLGEPARRLCDALKPGAARNALDCALWDLTARQGHGSVSRRLGIAPPGSVVTAATISLDTPGAMALAAARLAQAPLLKIKLGADDPAARLAAVARAAPGAQLIVDANEGWTPTILRDMADPISRLPVVLVEQPLPADQDDALEGISYPAAICADESAHTAADVAWLAGRYQMVNVKLDKAGGLTGAMDMVRTARAHGLGVLAGCMVSSSLAIAPALFVAAGADFVDLDGPWWLARDRAGGCQYRDGHLYAPQPAFWGDEGPDP